jgi:hypothetical protein
MASEGFGSGLWEQVSAVRLREDGSLQAPVRANGRHGIVVGIDQTARSDAAAQAPPGSGTSTPWWRRLVRH